MAYRLVIRRHSGTVRVHDAAGTDPRCQARTEPEYETVEVETWADVERVIYREGLKPVGCVTCGAGSELR